MPRRTRPQHVTDDLAFPVRVKFLVPPRGMQSLGYRYADWLAEHVGPGRYAVHSGHSIAGHATAIYFRDPADVLGFVAAHPRMTIADGTLSPAYSAPGRPSRR